MPAYPYPILMPRAATSHLQPWVDPGPAPGTVTCADANANADANAMTWLGFLVRVDPCLEDPSVRVAAQRGVSPESGVWSLEPGARSCGGWEARKAQRLGGRPAV